MAVATPPGFHEAHRAREAALGLASIWGSGQGESCSPVAATTLCLEEAAMYPLDCAASTRTHK